MRRRVLASFYVVATLVAGATVPGHATGVVEILLRGRFFVEPATVRITVAVEPDAANRVLRIEADGEQLFRASELTLNGADEKRLHGMEFRSLPAGGYTLRAAVLDSKRHVRAVASQELVVTGSAQR